MIIYKVTNKINNKIYIGQTHKQASDRLNDHYREAKSKKKNNKTLTYFHNAILYYGLENFTIEVIDTALTEEELNNKEIYWINYYDSMNREKGYNRQTGGSNALKSEETKQLISERKKENWQNPEIAEKMREGLHKATKAWQEKSLNNKVEFICPLCGNKLILAPWEVKNKKYCSQKCAAAATQTQRLEGAKKAAQENKEKRYESYRKEVEIWVEENKELILNCPFNKISSNLSYLQQLGEKYGITDWRIISNSICGKNSRKDLLVYLKQKCENVR